MKETFGGFIKQKRIEKRISLRYFSKLIDISPEYLSKIENNLRAAPKDDILKIMAYKLNLNVEERELLFDLAAKSKPYLSLASDLIEYINENEIVHKTLRLAIRRGLTNDEWQKVFDQVCETHL